MKQKQSLQTAHRKTPQEGEPQNNQEVLSGKRVISRIIYTFFVILTVIVGIVLYQRTDLEYSSELQSALSKLTRVDHGVVTVTAEQAEFDATVETSFLAKRGRQQQVEAVLRYPQSPSLTGSIRLLDISDAYFVELPLGNTKEWVKLGNDNDEQLLQDLGYPVQILIGEDAHTPLLPFGNFEDEFDDDINNALRAAFKDALFVRADEGELEYQVELTMREVLNIISSTARSVQPMDTASVVELYGERKALQLTVRVNRDTEELESVKVITARNGEEVSAIYEFDYDVVELEQEPDDAMTASQFVDLYLQQISR